MNVGKAAGAGETRAPPESPEESYTPLNGKFLGPQKNSYSLGALNAREQTRSQIPVGVLASEA